MQIVVVFRLKVSTRFQFLPSPYYHHLFGDCYRPQQVSHIASRKSVTFAAEANIDKLNERLFNYSKLVHFGVTEKKYDGMTIAA